MAGVSIFGRGADGAPAAGGRRGLSVVDATELFERSVQAAEAELGVHRHPYTGELGTGFLVGNESAGPHRIITFVEAA
ncbi:Uncharacterised protein (plasmid) [Tsukamurella tyrosinosolvens]|uniref:Uncharacterized protein n=1 Tax=Tsukamurella tyrosinosolvens TaxID=57704 RepID=A0A1H4V706_TSUTY|nr:hypothetical protein [Tsukamurella tyrosinosolvens]KXO91031.1 hypothetical protein AXK58_21615 [Tsukamurella tyrosinosolvens]SEC76892.1 hypothetical protein SAMN04489793_3165 [Tsukamurella tyrosinosolvens]VEH90642.1 Uncharacterised protein [Tsukamurella tyrosinosolvens]